VATTGPPVLFFRSYGLAIMAIDLAGSILLLLVDPKRQRRRLGTTPLELATSRLQAAGVRRAHQGAR